MMIYASHDFSKNYLFADAYKDNFQKTEIILDEVARAIIVNKKRIVDLLRKEGINATINSPILDITNWTLKLILKSDSFTKHLVDIVLIETNVDTYDITKEKDDNIKKHLEKSDFKKLIEDGIRYNLQLIAQSDRKVKHSNYSMSLADLLRQRVELSFNMEGAADKFVMPLWGKIAAVTVLGCAAFMGVLYLIGRFSGGGVNGIPSGVTPINEATPAAPAAPATDYTEITV